MRKTRRRFLRTAGGAVGAGRNPKGPADDIYLDITRIREDTGCQSEYDTGAHISQESAGSGWVGWSRSMSSMPTVSVTEPLSSRTW
jgi:hypothetical protein